MSVVSGVLVCVNACLFMSVYVCACMYACVCVCVCLCVYVCAWFYGYVCKQKCEQPIGEDVRSCCKHPYERASALSLSNVSGRSRES
jgi:hypothetical protein